MIRRAGIFFFLLVVTSTLAAQDYRAVAKNTLSIAYAPGGIYKHTPELESLGSFRGGSLVLDWSRQTDSSSSWGFSHDHPAYGISLIYSFYEAPSLGYSLAIVPFIENTLPAARRIGFYYHLGLGLGYQSEVYDPLKNPDNLALSSHVNIAFDLRLGLALKVAEPLSVRVSGNLLHYSNGASKLPNFGLNLAQLNFALSYHFPEKVYFTNESIHERVRSLEWLAMAKFGLRQFEADGDYFGVQSLLLEANQNLGQGNYLGVGWAFMNDAVYLEYEQWAGFWGDGNHAPEDFWSTLNFGPYLNYEFRINGFSAYLQTGVYLFSGPRTFTTEIDYGNGPFVHETTLPDTQVFNRVGTRYRFSERWVVDLGMKTHMFKAQNLELGLGYRL